MQYILAPILLLLSSGKFTVQASCLGRDPRDEGYRLVLLVLVTALE